jgi:four helix bundle protein
MEHDAFSFEKLEVFRVAREALAAHVAVRACFRGLPGEIAPQLERALVSVVANIAEGAGRESRADQRRHFTIARGSAQEAAAILSIAELYGVVPEEARVLMRKRLLSTVKMLFALAR